jgi:hypothetical protein
MPPVKPTPTILLVALALASFAVPAAAQSLSPMTRDGKTPSATKAFKLQVGNPYKERMTFVLTPMNTDFTAPISGAQVKPAKLTMAPGFSRQVILSFDIDPKAKERTIGLCVTPADINGPIQPRVCGLYTGRMLTGAGG